MTFDFDTFSALVTKAYQRITDHPYTLKDVLSIFQYYFEAYEKKQGQPHPHIRQEQIWRIIHLMPWVDPSPSDSAYEHIGLEEYLVLIDQHFKTKYRHCDYNINHFFSGRIRELRFYETCY